MVAGGSSAAAAAAAIARAIKASGTIVRVEPTDFLSILARTSKPLIVISKGGFLSKHLQYLTSYKGLAFFTKSSTPLQLPGDIEVIDAKRIWIP
jgi:hypothetical protein